MDELTLEQIAEAGAVFARQARREGILSLEERVRFGGAPATEDLYKKARSFFLSLPGRPDEKGEE